MSATRALFIKAPPDVKHIVPPIPITVRNIPRSISTQHITNMSAQAARGAVKAAGKAAEGHVLNKGAKRDPELYVGNLHRTAASEDEGTHCAFRTPTSHQLTHANVICSIGPLGRHVRCLRSRRFLLRYYITP